MTQTIDTISVIICAYTEERWSDLVAAVESVRRQTLAASEIIIVIDHNPLLLKRVRSHIPNVIVIENTDRRGLSGARNSGIAIARGNIVVFLDDDAVATPDWLMFLSEAFSDLQVLGAGGPVIPLWLDKEPPWFPEEFHWVVGCTYRGLPQSYQLIRNPIGANMAFRREVFDTVGGFRNEIGRVGSRPLGCEETELCIRARQHWPQRGFLYQPHARVFHRVSGNRTRWSYFCARCYAEGVSKAFITQYIGIKDSLATERTYTFRTLPLGIIRGLMDALFRHNLRGFAHAWTIIVGLAITTVGYLVGSLFLRIPEAKENVVPGAVFRSNKNYHQRKLEGTSVEELLPSPIQPLIDAYLHALEPLRFHFYGIYIFGSIALGAFEELESDIDIIALTYGEWTVSELAQLKAIHTQLLRKYQFSKRLEVLYIPLRNLGKRNEEIAAYPSFFYGKFSPAGYGDLNYVTWWTVKNKGIRLLGPEPSTLPFQVAWQDVLETMRDNLDGYWASKAKHPYLFLLDGWIVIAVATLCRILTTVEEEEIIPKSVALKRWQDRLPARWRPLIEEAWRIRHHLGTPSLYRSRLERMREILAFIEYVRERGSKALEVTSQQNRLVKTDAL